MILSAKQSSTSDMESYYMWVVALLVIALTLKYVPQFLTSSEPKPNKTSIESKKSADAQPLLQTTNTNDEDPPDNITNINDTLPPTKLKEFATFQRWYIIIFLLVMLADWMQGPYVYKLYASYNIATLDIAILFIIGFGSSGLTGAFIGSLADKFGRKNMCILFCILYALCCTTKHYHNYNILLIGRFLGGVSTSILFSCFEAWMVTNHHCHAYPANKLGDTFEKAWSLNSFIAILAGIITSYAVSFYERHNIVGDKPAEIAAFDCSALTLIIACVMINLKWKQENYGDTRVDLKASLVSAFDLFKNDIRILLVGCIQSGFESAMYLFVFMWTMALESCRDGIDIDHGIIFAVFMEACLVGTTLSGILSKQDGFFQWKSEKIAALLCIVASFALLSVPYTKGYECRLLMFIIFECCVGIYFPIIGGLRGKYVPDNVRATIMNIFRIPLNIIVVVVLWYIDELGTKNVFILASILLLIASCAAYFLNNTSDLQTDKNNIKANGH